MTGRPRTGRRGELVSVEDERHGAGCNCQRCRGFDSESGAQIATSHGAYTSPLRLAPRAAELADLIRPHLPVRSPAFEPVLQSYALVLTRIEKACAALDEVDRRLAERGAGPSAEFKLTGDDLMGRLRQDLSRWLSQALKHADALGLTPSSQARLMRDAGVGKHAEAQATLLKHR